MVNNPDQNPNKRKKANLMRSQLLTFEECMEILVEPVTPNELAEEKYRRVKNRMNWSLSKAKRAVLGYIKRPYGDDLDKAREIAEKLQPLKVTRESHEAHIQRLTATLRAKDEDFYSDQIDALEQQIS